MSDAGSQQGVSATLSVFYSKCGRVAFSTLAAFCKCPGNGKLKLLLLTTGAALGKSSALTAFYRNLVS